MRPLIIGALAFLCVSPVYAGNALFENLTKTIKELCPQAEAKVDHNRLTVKYDTMVYTVHDQSGKPTYPEKYLARTRQDEGPNYKGFILQISLSDGPYDGQATVPRTVQGPYYTTFFNAVQTDDGKRRYFISFDYGRGLDPNLKNAIFKALPNYRSGTFSGTGVKRSNKQGQAEVVGIPQSVLPGLPVDVSELKHAKWLTSILKEATGIKTGMTRGDLLKVFAPEGGLSTRTQRTYGHARCSLVKVDVEFRPAQPEEKSRELPERQDDKIVKISKPYLAWPVMD